jgi:exopolysaccharide biosynthesis polyprenyl glycosylphosphotransferase
MSLAESEPVTASTATATASRVAAPPVPAPLGTTVATEPPALWHGRGLVCACILADALMLALAVAVVLLMAPAERSPGYELLLLLPIAGVLLLGRGAYSWGIGRSPLDAAGRATGAIVTAAMAVIVFALATGSTPDVATYALAVALAVAGCVSARALLSAGRRRALLHSGGGSPTLVVGTGSVGHRIAQRLLGDPTYGLRPIGFIDAGPDPEPGGGLPVLGAPDDLRAVAAATGARHVIIAFSPSARDAALGRLLRDCEQLGLDVSVVPRLFDAVNGNLLYQRVGGLPLMGLRPSSRNRIQLRIKRILDISVSLTLLTFGAPVLAAIALAVRLESPGPILFRQRRLGRDGQQYDVLKFRSMRCDDADASFVPAAGTAPGGVEGVDRRTRIGRFLRRTSLDELPQLLNVLRGDMSLVGPRPERPEYAIAFARDILRYDDRLRVRSGLTGWAQVNGLRGQTSIEDRVEWDNYYIEHWSLGLDLKILLMTLAVPFQPGES